VSERWVAVGRSVVLGIGGVLVGVGFVGMCVVRCVR